MRCGILPLFGFIVCGAAMMALPLPTLAQTLTGAPPAPVSADPLPMPPPSEAQGQPTDLLGPPPAGDMPAAAGAPMPPPAGDNVMPAMPVGPVPMPPDAASNASAPPDGLPAPMPASANAATPAPAATAAAAPADPASACPGSASDASDCLKKMDDQTMAELDRIQGEKLKALHKNDDWKDGKVDSQSLANSAMSFEAYRDTECARQKKGHDGDEADNIFMSCQIKMSQDRIALLQHQ